MYIERIYIIICDDICMTSIQNPNLRAARRTHRPVVCVLKRVKCVHSLLIGPLNDNQTVDHDTNIIP